MEKEASCRLLDVLIDNSRRVLDAGFGVNWAESSFFDVISLIRREPHLKPYFLDRVQDTLVNRDAETLSPSTVPPELIELVGHEFRWPELIELAENRVRLFFNGDAQMSVGDVSSRIKKASAMTGRTGFSTNITHNRFRQPRRSR